MRKKTIPALVTLAILAWAAGAPGGQTPGHPDFTGTWVFNAAKSKLQTPAPDSGVFRIDHKEPVFKLSRTFVTKGQEDTWGIDLTTDGKDVTQESATETFTGRLAWDGSALVLDSTIVMGARKASNIVRYSLSADGSVLTAEERFRGPFHQHDNLWVFDRKK